MTVLLPKDRPIAVVATSGAYNVDRFEAGLQILRERGYTPEPLPGHLAPHRYLAAPDATRRDQLEQALLDPTYGGVWLARGGYGITRILDDLVLPAQMPPKPVIGFSDMTALLGPLWRAGLGPAIHGPVIHSLASTNQTSLDHLFRLLNGTSTPVMVGESWRDGAVTAPIVGGNLCMLASTCGTRHQLNAQGCILVLEEVGEYAYRVDRMLQQLHSSGVFRGVVGIALGEFTSCRVPDDSDWSIDDILREALLPLGIPVVAKLPIGHGQDNRAFVMGGLATMHQGRLSLNSEPAAS